MKRYFFDGPLRVGERETLQGELFHHIFDVCRVKSGHKFELINEKGIAFLVEVEGIEKKYAKVKILEERVIPPLQEPFIHLYLSFPKIPVFESVIEKSVELGVRSITPILSDHSFVRTEKQFPITKWPRWQKIILQATQQCGRGDLMKIEKFEFLDHILSEVSSMDHILNIVAYEGEAPRSLRTALSSCSQKQLHQVNLFIGSEGGFSEKEVQKFINLDLPPVTLGDQVLRVETACMTLVACVKYEFDLLVGRGRI